MPKIPIAIIIIVVVIIAGAGGMAWWYTSHPPGPTPTPTSTPTLTPLKPHEARDLAMEYIKQQHPDAGQYINVIDWGGGRVTPEGIVGHETYEYTGGEWTVTVEYNVVAPENMEYEVSAQLMVGYGELRWEGIISNGEVNETLYIN